ncbi:polysaccharide biosynthesis protein [Candidatus Koribacter versatilis Ellin345]|uniref:Polysaccharide biosynthesis protein n=1 Tax=Koribacter versatilis (strain Ellin345) TaxID=204669 RepID=Q1ITA7_KORVE|nr:oligosaccharide flippase family protein [Candidatus Koribacter versatilis]ABF39893.1 polysaccharide biosynthesis protein [Candidatus Koribacter versatilis Ellin345]
MATSSESLTVGILQPRKRIEGAPLARNVVFSVVDYLTQPLLMLLTARYFVRALGLPLFGIWILVLAIIGSSGSICTGFGDAALKYVAAMRGRMDDDGVSRVIGLSAMLNLSMGIALALAFYALAPWSATHMFHLSGQLATEFVTALRIGGGVLAVRSLSFVFIGAFRAFELYERATQVVVSTRLATALAALVLVWKGFGVVAILWITLICEFGALLTLVHRGAGVWREVRVPRLKEDDWRSLTSFGFFGWVQALSGTLFSQADRLVVAALLGPSALTYYGVCVQCTQPIHGLTAAGCNVLFPHLSTKVETAGTSYLRKFLARAFRLNLLTVLGLAIVPLLLSRPLLTLWMGKSFSDHAAVTLSLVAASFALLALNVPGHYALMALGEVRYLTILNVAGCVLSLLLAWFFIPKIGIAGAAAARLAYGPLTWLLYARLQRLTSREEAR